MSAELRHYFVSYPTAPVSVGGRRRPARDECWRCHRPAAAPIHLEPDDHLAREAAIAAAAARAPRRRR